MNITPINLNNSEPNTAKEVSVVNFGHHTKQNNNYSAGKKALIATTSAIGVLASLAVLSKRAGYSLNPKKMFKNIRNSYLAKVDIEAKEVIAMGAGSCLGGLAGGFIVDKNKENRRAKVRESIMQIGNVSIPILTVHLMTQKVFKKASDGVRAFAGLGGVAIGVLIANLVMNKINNVLFNEQKGESRGVKATDFSAHLDDVVVAAHYIAPKSKIVHAIGRIVPAALVIPGLEVGNKTADSLNQ